MMKQAPAWLPTRLRTRLDNSRVHFAVRNIEKTRPYEVSPAGDADLQLFMLVCRRDIRPAMLATKSLLKHSARRWAVTFINDGSLPPRDTQRLQHHFPGARCLPYDPQDAAITPLLQDRPHLKHVFVNERFKLAAKILYPQALHDDRPAVLLDCDTAFFAQPELIDAFPAAPDADAAPLYMHDHQDEARVIPPPVRAKLKAFQQAMGLEGQWGVQHAFFNSGLLVFHPSRLDLDLADHYFRWLADADSSFQEGKAGIWFGPWTREQTAYMVMFAAADPPPRPLGDDYHLGVAPDKVFCHFLRHYLVRDTTLRMLRRLIETL